MIITVVGGASCGKSEIAEQLCIKLSRNIAYVATMQPFGLDAEYRIARHARLRAGKGFSTVEQYTDIAGATKKIPLHTDTLLIECMSNLVANEMFNSKIQAHNVEETIIDGISQLGKSYNNIIVVTSDVSSDGICYDEETMQYISAISRLNRRLITLCDVGIEVFCGIPTLLKGEFEL